MGSFGVTGRHAEFKAFLETRAIQAWLNTAPKEKTKEVYAYALWRYWRNSLGKTYALGWIDSVNPT